MCPKNYLVEPPFERTLQPAGRLGTQLLQQPQNLFGIGLIGMEFTTIFTKVRLMNAVPYLTDALKVAFPLALVGSIVGEFIGGNSGIGHLILFGQFNMDTPLVFAALFSITVFTTLGIGAVSLFERMALTWRPSQRRR